MPSQIARWVTSLFPEKDLVVGTYIYLDGELHVRATIAMDAILQARLHDIIAITIYIAALHLTI